MFSELSKKNAKKPREFLICDNSQGGASSFGTPLALYLQSELRRQGALGITEANFVLLSLALSLQPIT
jgi:hypothetical protein